MKIKAKQLFSYDKYWPECFGVAPYLPMCREEMDELGWDSCDIIVVCGDAYVDHPSFGMAVIGRFLESQGFRVGIIAQPDWNNVEDFKALGQPNLFFGVSAGNMDSLINRYTADLKVRSEDAYTPHGTSGKRPDRSVIVYSQMCKQAYKDTPIVVGGIEASLRRIAQYDYWSDQIRRSVLIDSAADLLLYGNAERAIAEVAHRMSQGQTIDQIDDIRGTCFVLDKAPNGWNEVDSTRIDWPGNIAELPNPYEYEHVAEGENNHTNSNAQCDKASRANDNEAEAAPVRIVPMPLHGKAKLDRNSTYIRLPSYEKVSNDSALYAHASRVLHLESNPNNAHVLIQKHGDKEVWVNPPPIPLETDEIDSVFDLAYQRRPHPSYGDAKIPAYDMIKFSVNSMRGCFGGCTFCSITEHEGRVIQSRSQESILKEIENIRDKTPGFTGAISDIGGPTANMYGLNCKDDTIQSHCRRLSCVYPSICENLVTSHKPTTELYRAARKIEGVKKISIASGLRYDLAVEDPEYIKELVTHHVGGYLKIAPEHTEDSVLSKMMKPGMGTYDAFKKLFDKYSKEAGKKQYLIPYFIAAHPGCTEKDMIALALWLKRNKLRLDQVQTFYPSPMSLATAMYHSERNPLQRVKYKDKRLAIPRDYEQRRVQKMLLRYHDPKNWPAIRQLLIDIKRPDLIGTGKEQLVPPGNNLARRSGVGNPGSKPSGSSKNLKGANSKFSKSKNRKPPNRGR